MMGKFVHNNSISDLPLETSLWRYMDFTKFVDLILSRELYLRRIDSFEDPYEGFGSEITKERLRDFLNNLYRNKEVDIEEMIQHQAMYWKIQKLYTYVNCWHINEYESAAMWNLYAKTNEAIAIKTNIRKILNCLERSKRPDSYGVIYLDKVFYIDYEKEAPISRYNNLGFVEHLFNKRKSFEHEREFRVLYMSYEGHVWTGENGSGGGQLSLEWVQNRMDNNDEAYKHKIMKIDITDLISEIYVSPTAPKWFHNMTIKFLKTLNLDHIPCVQSELYTLK